MPEYEPNYQKGDEFIVKDRFHTVLDVDTENKKYHLAWKGRLRWKSSQEIDAISKPRSKD